MGFGVRIEFKGTKQELKMMPGQNIVRSRVRLEVLGSRPVQVRGSKKM